MAQEGANDSRATKTIPPIPPHNPCAPKINQPAPVAISAEDNILVFDIPTDNAAYVQERNGVGDLAQVAPDKVRGQAHQVLLDEIGQILWGRRKWCNACIRIGRGQRRW